MNERTFDFVAPSGHSYTIREQNGDDDDILSNPLRAKTLQNLSDMVSAIVINNSRTNGKLTPDEAHELPTNDIYAIMFNSRIFSIGQTLEFEFDWGIDDGGKKTYEEDLSNFLFDYSSVPTEEELNSKPYAIPFYPNAGIEKDINITTTSGKQLTFDVLSGAGESYLLKELVRTKNLELKARNLKLLVNGTFERVENFKLFSVTDMKEIRKAVFSVDPLFDGLT